MNELPEPYTESSLECNYRYREVYCPECKYTIITNLPGPKCGKCHSNLITKIYEIKRI